MACAGTHHFFFRMHKMVRWCGHIVARFHRKICIKLKIWRKKRKQHFVIFYFPFCVNSLIWITSLSQQYQHIKWKSFRWWMRSSIYFNRTRSQILEKWYGKSQKIECFWQNRRHGFQCFSYSPWNSLLPECFYLNALILSAKTANILKHFI